MDKSVLAGEFELTDYEREWINEYYEEEASKSLEVEKPFRYYTIERSRFAQLLFNAANAKKDVGIATVNMWKFHIAAEMTWLFGKIGKEKMAYMQFLYSKIVQDYVIRGIKHVEGGSSEYEKYAAIGKNKDVVIEDLMQNHGVSYEDAKLFVGLALSSKSQYVSTVAVLPNGFSSVNRKRIETVASLDKSVVSTLAMVGKGLEDLKRIAYTAISQ
jgi:hypothetical protein